MTRTFLNLLSATTVVLMAANTAFAAGPPGGFHMGPPSQVMMGLPAGASMGPPSGVRMGPPEGVTMGPPSSVTEGTAAGAGAAGEAFRGRALGNTARFNSNHSLSTSVRSGDSAGASVGESSNSLANAAKFLGKLNAAHASNTALSHASPRSVVGALANYKSQTLSAQSQIDTYTSLVNRDQLAVSSAQAQLTSLEHSGTASQTQISQAQAQLNAAQQQLSSDQAQLSAAQAELVSAQNTLQTTTNRQLTPQVIARLNALLGISS